MTKTLTASQESTLAMIRAAGCAGFDYLTQAKGYNIHSCDALRRRGLVVKRGWSVWAVEFLPARDSAGAA